MITVSDNVGVSMLPWYSSQTSVIQSKAGNHDKGAEPKNSHPESPSTLLNGDK